MNLTKEEKLVLVSSIRLFLLQHYGIIEPLYKEKEVSEIMVRDLKRKMLKERDVDVIQKSAFDLYYKLVYKILQEDKNDGN